MNPREHFLLPNTTASLPVPANDTADLKLTHFRPKGTSDHPPALATKAAAAFPTGAHPSRQPQRGSAGRGTVRGKKGAGRRGRYKEPQVYALSVSESFGKAGTPR